MLWSVYVKFNDLYRTLRGKLRKLLKKEAPHVTLAIHDINQGQK